MLAKFFVRAEHMTTSRKYAVKRLISEHLVAQIFGDPRLYKFCVFDSKFPINTLKSIDDKLPHDLHVNILSIAKKFA